MKKLLILLAITGLVSLVIPSPGISDETGLDTHSGTCRKLVARESHTFLQKAIIDKGSACSFLFPAVSKPAPDERVVLSFCLRQDVPEAKGLAGWNNCFSIAVNGQKLTLWTPDLRCRLINKPVMIWTRSDAHFNLYAMYATDTCWVAFASAGFGKPSEEDPFLPIEGDPFRFELDISDVSGADSNTVSFINTGSAPLALIAESINIQKKPVPPSSLKCVKTFPFVSSRGKILACPLDYTSSLLLNDSVIRRKAENFPFIIDNYNKTMMSHDTKIVPGIGAKLRAYNPACRSIRYYCPTQPFWTRRDQPANQCEEMFEHIIKDWGFEDGNGWGIVNGKIEDGKGRNGSRGLVFDFKTDNTGWARSVPILVEPGRGVKIVGWVKTEKVSDTGASLFVEFYADKEGKIPIGEEGNYHVRNPQRILGTPLTGTHDWTLHHIGEWSQEYYSRPFIKTPDNAKSMRIGVMLQGTGKAVFDDIGRVYQLKYQPSARGLSNIDWFNTMPDWGSPAFHEFVKKEFRYIWERASNDGIFFDQLFTAILPGGNVTALPYDYDLVLFREKTIGLLKDITSYSGQHGKIVIGNHVLGPWPEFIYLPYLHGVLSEQMLSMSVTGSEDEAFPPEDIWKMQLSAIIRGEEQYPDRIFIPLSPVNYNDYRLRTFIMASFLLSKGDYSYLSTTVRSPVLPAEMVTTWQNTIRAEFGADLGIPLSGLKPVERTGFHVYTREFEKGQVFACDGGQGPYLIRLPHPARKMVIRNASGKNMAGEIQWEPVSVLQIKPREGVIILWK